MTASSVRLLRLCSSTAIATTLACLPVSLTIGLHLTGQSAQAERNDGDGPGQGGQGGGHGGGHHAGDVGDDHASATGGPAAGGGGRAGGSQAS
ncbi:hypothetical protein OL599_25290, partial [Rhodovastum sp. RN2-1]|nr:hypothetical protein [Limobrevibacterium gyesilva]